MNALGGHLEANARRLIAFIGQKQNRFSVLIQMPGVGPRSGPAIAFNCEMICTDRQLIIWKFLQNPLGQSPDCGATK